MWRVENGEVERHCGEKYHAVLTDPPYGLEFMGAEWDRLDVRQPGDENFHSSEAGPFARAKVRYGTGESYGGCAGQGMQAWHKRWAEAVLKVVYPGALMLCFGGTRTWHRLACGLEDAGWEILDTLVWMYGQGFPKAQKVEGAAVSHKTPALKPAWEPILLTRAPRDGKSYNELVSEYGSGLLNIDGARIPVDMAIDDQRLGGQGKWRTDKAAKNVMQGGFRGDDITSSPLGRYPANVILECTCDHLEFVDQEVNGSISGKEPSSIKERSSVAHGPISSRAPFSAYSGKVAVHTDPNCPAAILDKQTGDVSPGVMGTNHTGKHENLSYGFGLYERGGGFGDSGGPSRFFYCAKADRPEREAGLFGFEGKDQANPGSFQSNGTNRKVKNHHPTVKPLSLVRWLATLLLPPSGRTRRILIPFSGSGSEMIGAVQAEWEEVVGVEKNEEFCRIAEARLQYWSSLPKQMNLSLPTVGQLW